MFPHKYEGFGKEIQEATNNFNVSKQIFTLNLSPLSKNSIVKLCSRSLVQCHVMPFSRQTINPHHPSILRTIHEQVATPINCGYTHEPQFLTATFFFPPVQHLYENMRCCCYPYCRCPGSSSSFLHTIHWIQQIYCQVLSRIHSSTKHFLLLFFSRFNQNYMYTKCFSLFWCVCDDIASLYF